MTHHKLLKLLLASFIGISGVALAKPVTDQEAKTVAVNWLYKKSGKNVVADNLILSNKLLKTNKRATTLIGESFKVVNVKPEGWVIVTGDDRVKPIIGYSSTGTFSDTNLPPQLDWMLETFSKQITTYIEQRTQEVPLEISWKWETLKQNSKEYKEKNPFVKSNASSKTRVTTWKLKKDIYLQTPTWGQGFYYNAETPEDSSSSCQDGHTLTGCVATAMAEVMRYHSWPASATGSEWYILPNYNTSWGTNFGTLYNWSNMPMTSLSWHNNDVAQVMSDAGISVEANYGCANTGAFTSRVDDELEQHFDYWTQGYQTRSSFNTDSWHSMIKTDLRQGNPVIYRGTNSVGANGHAFVIEGFDIEGSWYEINFGWNGASNGSYTIDDITPGNSDYSFNQAAVFGIKPNNSTYRDRYELDNTWETSSFMTVNATQQGHSIDPKSDVDWTWFYNDTAGTVTIDTINSNGDTVMRLYDYYGNYIAYDDDGGVDYLSKITRSLAVGRYYIKVQSYGGDSTISSYDLRVSQ